MSNVIRLDVPLFQKNLAALKQDLQKVAGQLNALQKKHTDALEKRAKADALAKKAAAGAKAKAATGKVLSKIDKPTGMKKGKPFPDANY